MGQVLEVNDLRSGYGKLLVLKGVSLRVAEGEVVCLLGANGAGKSTLLKTISGLIKPKAGEILFQGLRVNGMSPDRIAKLGISHVPEGRQIFTGLTVRQNLLLGTYGRNMKKNEIDELLEYSFQLFPVLKQRINQKAGTLSGGEQQMLAIARGLMSKPKLLLLDEPSLGLAPTVVEAIAEVIISLKERGIPILMVEQNVGMSLAVAQRAYVIRTGEIILEKDAKALLEDEELKRSYLGL